MARITTEDCFGVISNRFELCLIAANRAKAILSGASTTIFKKEKPAVIALREIAEGRLDIEVQKKNIVKLIKNRGANDITSIDQKTFESIADETSQVEDSTSFNDQTFVDENQDNDN